jgi:Fe-S-cluster containining protein
MMSDCLNCGLCCRKLIIDIGCHDIVCEPRLSEVATLYREVGDGLCGFDAENEPLHDQPCHLLACGKPCPMLGPDNRCTIYTTRPNACVGFKAGGAKCLELREMYKDELVKQKARG